KERFWSDGEKRRTLRLPDKNRTFDETQDTFACRFYHRLVTNSPCESEVTLVEIRLLDPQGRPLSFAPCLVTEEGKTPRADRAYGAPQTPSGTTPAGTPGSAPANDKEDAFIKLRVRKLPTTVNLKWNRAKATEGATAPPPNASDPDDFEYEINVAI